MASRWVQLAPQPSNFVHFLLVSRLSLLLIQSFGHKRLSPSHSRPGKAVAKGERITIIPSLFCGGPHPLKKDDEDLGKCDTRCCRNDYPQGLHIQPLHARRGVCWTLQGIHIVVVGLSTSLRLVDLIVTFPDQGKKESTWVHADHGSSSLR